MDRIDILYTINVQGHGPSGLAQLDLYGTVDNPLFLAVDVARLIDYSVGRTNEMISRVDEDEKLLLNTHDTTVGNTRGNPAKWFLTEYGLYEILMQSRKPIARRFKSAIKDILHDLRMKGESNFEDLLNHEDFLVTEWEELNQQRDLDGLPDLTWEDFLRSKGYTDDML